ncbi:MAG: cyclic nucleotide-binding domain-containing protein [Pseudonocardiales bacterium]|nr:cyclic nucleotide-binding domain-containing protein [Pseudonocardiales bacterium]
MLSALMGRFELRDVGPGSVIVREGESADQLFIIAHGKVNKIGPGKYGEPTVLDTLSDGQYFGDVELVQSHDTWTYTVTAVTPCKVLALPEQVFQEQCDQSVALQAQVDWYRSLLDQNQNEHGEGAIEPAVAELAALARLATHRDH